MYTPKIQTKLMFYKMKEYKLPLPHNEYKTFYVKTCELISYSFEQFRKALSGMHFGL